MKNLDNSLEIISITENYKPNPKFKSDPHNESSGYIHIILEFKMEDEHDILKQYIRDTRLDIIYESPLDFYSASPSTSTGYVEQDTLHLELNPETGVFTYSEYVGIGPATKGILEEISLLGNGVNYSRTTAEFHLVALLQALSRLWD